jgi:hypothetical protein
MICWWVDSARTSVKVVLSSVRVLVSGNPFFALYPRPPYQHFLSGPWPPADAQ